VFSFAVAWRHGGDSPEAIWMAVAKITKRFVGALTPSASTQIFYDTELKGFGLRLMKTGVGSYFVEYRAGGGGRRIDKRRMKLGRVGELTPDEARKQRLVP
jgi:hypothetical protein